MQQHVTRFLNVPPAPRCVTYYLKSITDDAKDYLQVLVDGFASEEQQRKGNDRLATLYDLVAPRTATLPPSAVACIAQG